MNNTIKCNNCGAEIEVSEALRHQLEESVRLEESKKFEKKIEEIKKQTEEKVEKETQEKLAKELTDKDEQILKLEKRAQEAEAEELKIRKEKREIEEAKRRFEIEKQRQLDEEREKIRKTAQQEVEEKDRFKFAEYEKKLADMKKAVDEARRKGDQSSQQLQGEVLELDFEQLLRNTFLDDEIVAVGKGTQGADIIQKVKGKSGRIAGIILWETKRAKWKPSWLPKLREDARKEGASTAVLVSIDLPKEITDFQSTPGGVIICSYKSAVSLAVVLRRSVLHIAVAKQTAAHKDENLELLYDYLQSEAFRHRFEAFVEGIIEMQENLEYEKRAMERIWKKREVQIKKTLLNASRMYGELQGVMGNALPDIKPLSLPEGKK